MKRMRIKVTVERLKELLDYDPMTGLFKWKVRRKGVEAGDVAGAVNHEGYISIGIDNSVYKAHRLAWLYMFGRMPNGMMDHRNGDRADNRIENLREATPGQNSQNKHVASAKNKSSGLMGVSWSNDRNKFYARICVNGKVRALGRFDTAEEAHQAYLAAKRELHPFAEGGRS